MATYRFAGAVGGGRGVEAHLDTFFAAQFPVEIGRRRWRSSGRRIDRLFVAEADRGDRYG